MPAGQAMNPHTRPVSREDLNRMRLVFIVTREPISASSANGFGYTSKGTPALMSPAGWSPNTVGTTAGVDQL